MSVIDWRAAFAGTWYRTYIWSTVTVPVGRIGRECRECVGMDVVAANEEASLLFDNQLRNVRSVRLLRGRCCR